MEFHFSLINFETFPLNSSKRRHFRQWREQERQQTEYKASYELLRT